MTRPKVVAIVQARMRSTRLPGKILKMILGRPVLDLFLERLASARQLGEIVVATTDVAADDAVVDFARRLGYASFRGSEEDVLDRFIQCARAHAADWIVRVTSDCPAVDPALVDEAVVRALADPPVALVVNNNPKTYPHGLDVEVVRRAALEAAWADARAPREREHVTPFVREHPDRFPAVNLPCPGGDHSALRVTLDTPTDLDLLTRLFEDLYPRNRSFTWRDIVAAYDRHPEWRSINPPPKA